LQKQVKQMSVIIGWPMLSRHDGNLDVKIGLFQHPCQVQACVGTRHMNIGQHNFELLVARQNGIASSAKWTLNWEARLPSTEAECRRANAKHRWLSAGRVR
jgi:hypothetical protein